MRRVLLFLLQLLQLLLLLLMCVATVVSASSASTSVEATVAEEEALKSSWSIVSFRVEHGGYRGSSSQDEFTFLLVDAQLPQPTVFHIEKDEDEDSDPRGIAQLVCSGGLSFPSLVTARKGNASFLFPSSLVPMSSYSSFFPHNVLYYLGGYLVPPLSAATSEIRYTAAIFLNATFGDGSPNHIAWTLPSNAQEKNCHLQFLSPLEQKQQQQQQHKETVIVQTQKVMLSGRLAPVTLPKIALSYENVRDTSWRKSGDAVMSRHQVLEMTRQLRQSYARLPMRKTVTPTSNEKRLGVDPASNWSEHMDVVELEEAFRSDAYVHARIAPVDAAVKGIVSGMAKGIAGDVGKSVAGPLLDGLTSSLGQQVETELTDELMQKLVAETTGLIGEGLGPNAAMGITAALEDSIPRDISEQASDLIADSMSKHIGPAVTETLSRTIVPHVKNGVPEEMALDLVRPLVHILARSLPHTIAPALTQTIRHSPNQDYMCYFCYTEKRWCEYCHPAPLQTVYASYYTGLFSTHYSDYYNDYFFNYFEAILRPPRDNEAQPIMSEDTGQSLGDRAENQAQEEFHNNYGPEFTAPSK